MLFPAIMTAFAAYSQHTDTIHVNKPQFVRLLVKGEQSKMFEVQRNLLLSQVDTLKARIVIKELMIENLSVQVADYKNIVQSQESIIRTMQDQRTILESQIGILNKQIKKERRKKFFVTVAGVLATGGALFLYFTK